MEYLIRRNLNQALSPKVKILTVPEHEKYLAQERTSASAKFEFSGTELFSSKPMASAGPRPMAIRLRDEFAGYSLQPSPDEGFRIP